MNRRGFLLGALGLAAAPAAAATLPAAPWTKAKFVEDVFDWGYGYACAVELKLPNGDRWSTAVHTPLARQTDCHLDVPANIRAAARRSLAQWADRMLADAIARA